MTGEMKIGTRERQTSLRVGRCGKKLITKRQNNPYTGHFRINRKSANEDGKVFGPKHGPPLPPPPQRDTPGTYFC
jgi:hypothetical protein